MLPPKLQRSVTDIERLQPDEVVFAEKRETVPAEIQRSNYRLQRISESAA